MLHRDWFGRSTRPSTGRPLDPASDAEEDQERLSALNQQQKNELADLRSMATMSLSDSHGLLLEAIEKAYENRVPVGGVKVGKVAFVIRAFRLDARLAF